LLKKNQTQSTAKKMPDAAPTSGIAYRDHVGELAEDPIIAIDPHNRPISSGARRKIALIRLDFLIPVIWQIVHLLAASTAQPARVFSSRIPQRKDVLNHSLRKRRR
jgi:hypothetical protein